MTEEEYIFELGKGWPGRGDASLKTVAFADEAVRAFPRSPKLWCMRGDIIQLGPENCPHDLEEALASYKRAIEIEPSFAEAWESVGHFLKNVLDDEAAAEPYFREADKLASFS